MHFCASQPGELGARSAPAVDVLVAILEPLVTFGSPGDGNGGFGVGFMPERNAYYVAIKTLGKIGPSAKPALPVLQKVLAMSKSPDGFDPFSSAAFGSAAHAVYYDVTVAAIAQIEGRATPETQTD